MAGFKEFAHEIRRRETSYPVATGDHLAMYSLKNNRVYIIDDTGCLADFQINDVYAADVQISGQCLIIGQHVLTDTIIDGNNLVFRFDVDEIAALSGNMANSNPELADWQMDVYSISGVDNGLNQMRLFDNASQITHVSWRKGGHVLFGNTVESKDDDGHTVQVYGSEIVTGELTSPKGDSYSTQNNEAFGKNSLTSVTTGYKNTAVGVNTLASNTTGNSNVAIGYDSLYNNETGNNNISIGTSALKYNTIGNTNVAIGINTLTQNTSGDANIAIGVNSLINNIDGSSNTAVGVNTLNENVSGYENVAVGRAALYSNTTGYNNVAVGRNAMRFNIGGSLNVSVGYYGLYNNDNGVENTGIGAYSLYNNIDGSGNTAVGITCMYENTTGSFNTGVGGNSVRNNKIGNFNTGAGYSAMNQCVSGDNNVAVGYASLFVNLDGQSNTAVGSQALYNNVGSSNVAIGYKAGYSETGSNKLYIANADGTSNQALIYGEFDTGYVRALGALSCDRFSIRNTAYASLSATTSTYTIPDNISAVTVACDFSVNDLTIYLPANPYDGQIIFIYVLATGLTLSYIIDGNGTGIMGNPVFAVPSVVTTVGNRAQSAIVQYYAAVPTWRMIG
jgi:hypothetical protein